MNIKELAEQAGIGSLYGKNWAYSNELTRFAELVAAAEREKILQELKDEAAKKNAADC